jgi:methylthioribose-1-phosphate isomerase
LPGSFEVLALETADDAAAAIRNMAVRGAPLIGAAGAYGLALAARSDPTDAALHSAYGLLAAARPTGRNLVWALDRMMAVLGAVAPPGRERVAFAEAALICDEDVAINEAIGRHGVALIEEAARRSGREPVQVMTHCNAGWLATVDRGTALAPVYEAHERGVPVHVWVSETRPRNQGSALTAWELAKAGVAHTVVVDSACGHLMQRGSVDAVFVGTDRVSANGDVANKIGTYMKALAARANHVPFYVAAPTPTIDGRTASGDEIPIEERSAAEVSTSSPAANPAFDVTPAELVTALITERGIEG